MPAPPRRPPHTIIKRMTGIVTGFNAIHHDIVARGDQYNNIIYIPSSGHTGPEVETEARVVFLDRRGISEGFRRGDTIMAPARVFGLVQKNRSPVLYVMMGMAPSKPVPAAQAAAQRMASYSRPNHS